MAGKKKQERLFGRTDAKAEGEHLARTRSRREAVSRLCGDADFRAWLYDALDDLCVFARDEGLVTEFGQGIRAAANRLRNRLLETKEAVEMLTEFARREFTGYHAGVVAREQDNQE